MSEDMNELVATVELGEEARKFMESDLYRCLVGMADQEVKEAQMELSICDAFNWRNIQVLQNKVRAGTWFEQWLRELVDRGNAAMMVYKQSQEQ